MLDHDPGPGHPECAQRLVAIVEALRRLGHVQLTWPVPTPATQQQLRRVHAAQLVNMIEGLEGQSAVIDADTHMSPGSARAAHLAAGAAVEAVNLVVQDTATRRAMALCRPPGHHAEPDRAMGFCLFNNVAVAAAHAIEALGCRRILIVDWDVHHGNGTQAAFYDRSDVVYVSSHRAAFYPGTGSLDERGAGEGLGYTVNLPLPAGCDDTVIAALYEALLPAVARACEPDLVLVSAGFDAHRADPLGGMGMSADGFAALCATVCRVADEHADGRLVLVLEGGYDLEALAGSMCRCAEVLSGAEARQIPPPQGAGAQVVQQLIEAHR